MPRSMLRPGCSGSVNEYRCRASASPTTPDGSPSRRTSVPAGTSSGKKPTNPMDFGSSFTGFSSAPFPRSQPPPTARERKRKDAASQEHFTVLRYHDDPRRSRLSEKKRAGSKSTAVSRGVRPEKTMTPKVVTSRLRIRAYQRGSQPLASRRRQFPQQLVEHSHNLCSLACVQRIRVRRRKALGVVVVVLARGISKLIA